MSIVLNTGIYVITDDNSGIKIGYSHDICSRIASHQSSNPSIRCIAIYPNLDIDDEQNIHKLLWDYSNSNAKEWYIYSEDIFDIINIYIKNIDKQKHNLVLHYKTKELDNEAILTDGKVNKGIHHNHRLSLELTSGDDFIIFIAKLKEFLGNKAIFYHKKHKFNTDIKDNVDIVLYDYNYIYISPDKIRQIIDSYCSYLNMKDICYLLKKENYIKPSQNSSTFVLAVLIDFSYQNRRYLIFRNKNNQLVDLSEVNRYNLT